MAGLDTKIRRMREEAREAGTELTDKDISDWLISQGYGGALGDKEGQLYYQPGDWGTAGYDPLFLPVTIDGQQYMRTGAPGTVGKYNNPQTMLYQGRPYLDYQRYDPTYGWVIRQDAGQDYAKRYGNRTDFFTDFLPALTMAAAGGLAGLHAAAVGAPSLGQALGQATGLTSGSGISPTLAQAAVPTDFNMAAAANAGDAAALGQFAPVAPGGAMDMGIGLEGLFNYTSPAVSGGLPSWLSPAASAASTATTLLGGEGGAMDMYGSTSPNAPPGSADVFNYQSPPMSLADILSATSAAGQTATALKNLLGVDISPSALGMLGTLGSTALGAYGANQQANALENIANQARNDRLPFLQAAQNMLTNPESYYQRPEVMGAVDAGLRGLSAQVGNPINNPGALGKMAAYNLGGYQNALSSMANLGLAGQDLTSRLQTNAALANNGVLNAVGSGLGSLLSTQPNLNNVLAQYLLRSV